MCITRAGNLQDHAPDWSDTKKQSRGSVKLTRMLAGLDSRTNCDKLKLRKSEANCEYHLFYSPTKERKNNEIPSAHLRRKIRNFKL